MTNVLRFVVLGLVALSAARTATASEDGLVFVKEGEEPGQYRLQALRTGDLATENCENEETTISGYQFTVTGGDVVAGSGEGLKKNGDGLIVKDNDYMVSQNGNQFLIFTFAAATLLPPCWHPEDNGWNVVNEDNDTPSDFFRFEVDTDTMTGDQEITVTDLIMTNANAETMSYSVCTGADICECNRNVGIILTHGGEANYADDILVDDCLGVCLGLAEMDPCGTCHENGKNEALNAGDWQEIPAGACNCDGHTWFDCEGTCGGDVTLDACGVCGGNAEDEVECCASTTPGDVDQNNSFDIEDAKALADGLVRDFQSPCATEVLNDFVNDNGGDVDLHDVLGLVSKIN